MWQAVTGSNQIKTEINRFIVTIRFCIQDGNIVNVDKFRGTTNKVVGK